MPMFPSEKERRANPTGPEYKCHCLPGYVGIMCEYNEDTVRQPAESVDKRITNLLLCVFFLLILPTLIIYLIRTLYLFLKRCNSSPSSHSHHHLPREVTVSLGPPMSMPCPEATFDGPPVRRPAALHGTSSLTIHNTASMSLTEFNELLASLQSLQQLQMIHQPRSFGTANIPYADENIDPVRNQEPPPYDSVARTESLRSL
ncbi:hypothetical protein Ddc_12503 [Ditylenchus destructor]|nr:hypothetical protein Ddc_12503 [Ditylenchus destructor]